METRKRQKGLLKLQLVFVISPSDFIHFFHFVRDSCESHNSFNQQQAKLASAGMLQSLWFWLRAMWTMQSKEEPFIWMCIPFICVTLASAICIFERESESAAEDSDALSSVVLASRPQSRQQEQGVYSVLITCLIGSLRSSYFKARCAEGLFYWFLIKSCNLFSAAAPYSFIPSFSHCLSTSVMLCGEQTVTN